MEDTLRRTLQRGSALAVALSALVLNQGTATAQTQPEPEVVTVREFYGHRVRFGVPTTNSLHINHGGGLGIPAYFQDPGDPRCMWLRGHRVCNARAEDILRPATESAGEAVGQALHERADLYTTGMLIARRVQELSNNTHPVTDQRREAIRVEIQGLIQAHPNTMVDVCAAAPINDCLPPATTNGALADALLTLQRSLNEARGNVICAFACPTARESSFCREHHLGELATIGWDHPAREDGSMARCTASDEDPLCQRRPTVAMRNLSCTSVNEFWSTGETVRAVTGAVREETDRRMYLASVSTELHLAELAAQQPPSAPPPVPAVADRDSDTVPDANDHCPDQAQGEHPDPSADRAGCPAPELEVAPPRGERRVARGPRAPHVRRPAVTRPATPPPAFDQEVEGMECTAPTTRGAQWMTTCVIRASNAASANFEHRAIRADGMHATSGTLPAEYSHLAARMTRYRRVVRTILQDNPGTSGECSSPVILACRKTGWTRANPQYFRRRIGICTAANGNTNPVTLESFVVDAATECESGFHVSVWGVTGGHVRLRFDRDPTVTLPEEGGDDPPGGQHAQLLTPAQGGSVESDTRHAVASFDSTFNTINGADRTTATTNIAQMMTPGTTRTVLATRDFVYRRPTTARIARPRPTPRPNARNAEVMARAPTTPDDNVSEIGSPPLQATRCRLGMRCWWLPPTSAIA